MFRRAVLIRLAVCLSLLGACNISPQPIPPMEPTLDARRVAPGTQEIIAGGVLFSAKPGAVSPPEGNVEITNLDTTDAPTVVPVAEDGSFKVDVSGAPTDEFRLQAVNTDGRSAPVDLVLSADFASFELAPRPLADCLRLEPPLVVELAGSGDARGVVVRNDCKEELPFLAPRLRRGQATFTFTPTAPFVLAPGSTETISVSVGAGAEAREDVLFLETDGATRDRRPLTLFVDP